MISNQVRFQFYERPNAFRKSGKEWALSVQFVNNDPWVIKDWEKEPTPEIVEDVKKVAMRCFEFYHNHLQIPRFDITQVD